MRSGPRGDGLYWTPETVVYRDRALGAAPRARAGCPGLGPRRRRPSGAPDRPQRVFGRWNRAIRQSGVPNLPPGPEPARDREYLRDGSAGSSRSRTRAPPSRCCGARRRCRRSSAGAAGARLARRSPRRGSGAAARPGSRSSGRRTGCGARSSAGRRGGGRAAPSPRRSRAPQRRCARARRRSCAKRRSGSASAGTSGR